MRKRLLTTALAVFVVLAVVVLAIAIHDRKEERLPESEESTINEDSLRKINQSLPPKYVIECDSVYRLDESGSGYRLNEDNLKTLEDSIHFFEDGY